MPPNERNLPQAVPRCGGPHLHDAPPRADGQTPLGGRPAADVQQLHEVGPHLHRGVQTRDRRAHRHRRGKEAHVAELHRTAWD